VLRSDRLPTLLELCVDRGGLLKGMRICSFIIEWSMCAGALGREPLVVEFRDWWKANDRSTWRRLAEFREMFDTDATPQIFTAAIAPDTFGELADLGGRADTAAATVAAMRARLTYVPAGISTQGPLGAT